MLIGSYNIILQKLLEILIETRQAQNKEKIAFRCYFLSHLFISTFYVMYAYIIT